MGYAYSLLYGAATVAGNVVSAVRAFLSRVIADGGTTADPTHPQVVYDDTIAYDPTLIQSCDSGKATVLYNIEPTNADFTVDRNSAKYVLGSGGTIISYATDEPAFEFNADGSYKGLLVEPAATNICLQSEDITTTWSPFNATIAANATTAPDGTTTADELRANTTSQTYVVQQNYPPDPSANHTFSVFAKKDELNYIQLSFANTSQQYANFDLDLGVVGTKGSWAASSTIEDYGNGWYRCSVHINVGSIPSFGIAIVPSASASWRQAVSAGSSSEGIFVWGAQLETGPIATSYIPTTTASVTRNKDDITLGSASSLIGQTEGTLYVEVDWRLSTASNQILINVDNGNANHLVIYTQHSASALRMYALVNSVTVTDQGESYTSYSGIQKFAFAYKTNDFELYRNGSSISSDTSGSLAALATLTNIDIGQYYNAQGQANMWIRAVALYPKRLSDAEAQALTTL